MIYQLHTRSQRRYRGKYPRRINSWSYARSARQDIVAKHLDMKRPVHLELNDGTRFIADMSDLDLNGCRVGIEFSLVSKAPCVIDLTQDRYNAMLAEIRSL